MAHFRGTVQGNRGEASRIGHPKDGLRTDCNGWTAGVRVQVSYNPETKQDEFTITRTEGGTYEKHVGVIAEFKVDA